KQFQAHFANVRYGVAGYANRQRWEKEEMAPTVGGRPHKRRYRYFPILKLTEVIGQAYAIDQIFGSLVVNHAAYLIGDKIGIGARRLIALVSPRFISGHGLATDELKRLGARFI